MPIIKSAKKALRQNVRHYVRNLKQKRAIDDVFKKIRVLSVRGKAQEAIALLPQAYKALDKAAKKGVITKNTASRKKSRLTKRLQKPRSK